MKLGSKVHDATRVHVVGTLSNYGPESASVCVGPGRYAQVRRENLRQGGKQRAKLIADTEAAREAGLTVKQWRASR